jgi:hypothetical protein
MSSPLARPHWWARLATRACPASRPGQARRVLGRTPLALVGGPRCGSALRIPCLTPFPVGQ